jgi:hypothetical protein
MSFLLEACFLNKQLSCFEKKIPTKNKNLCLDNFYVLALKKKNI